MNSHDIDKKQFSITIHVVSILYLSIFLWISIFNNTFWGDILSPIGTTIAALFCFNTAQKNSRFKSSWIFFAIAALCWTITEALWAYYELVLKINPENIQALNIMYLLPNLSILFACSLYAYRVFKKLNSTQLLLDLSVLSIYCLILFWKFMLHGNAFSFFHDTDDWILILYSISDFITLVGVFIWLFSFRKGRTTTALNVLILGIILYTCVDLIYCYMDFYGHYIPNSIIDFLYMLSFFLIAFSGIYIRKYNTDQWAEKFYSENNNIANTKLDKILLIPPIIFILTGQFDYIMFLIFIGIYLIYRNLSIYVQTSEKNNELLEKELNLNDMLDQQVKERTKKINEMSQYFQYLSQHDSVTNIYNGDYFNEYIDKILDSSNEPLAIVIIDINRFKAINDNYGRDVGDEVLVETSKRIAKALDENCIFARLSMDAFVIGVNKLYSNFNLVQLISNIINSFDNTINVKNYKIRITLSIGIATYPEDASTRQLLIRYADIAMHHAKNKGNNQYSFFNKQMTDVIQKRHQMEMLLLNADFEKELRLVYQPQIDIQQNKLVGFEALVRWESSTNGLIMPDRFISIAENIGCIEKIGDWVMREAAEQISCWNKKYNCNLKMGINISPKQLDGNFFIDKINTLIHDYQLNPCWLDFEVTENIAMQGESKMEEVFEVLSSLNITTSIDDFGTGYSSLSYIHQFSFDRIKIAKPLVDSVTTDYSKRIIIEAIVMIAKVLKLRTIAEGAETLEQVELLKELKCDEVQGYYYSRPKPAGEIEKEYFERNELLYG